MPTISVVIPLYNKEKEIQNTLQSVLQQTFDDFEIVIINDGSTDRSEEKVLSISDKRIQYTATQNQGVSQARNIGIARAIAPLIAFLDADDVWLPHHLEDLAAMHNDFPEAGLLLKKYVFAYPKNLRIEPTFNQIDAQNFRGLVPNFFKSSMPHRLAWTSAVAVPKKVFDQVGVFDTSITLGAGEDTDMWVRIALVFPVAFDSKISAIYKMDASNRISHSNTLQRNFSKLDKFTLQEKTNSFLKKFLDRYRLEYALKHKLAGDAKTFKFYYTAIDKKNIPFKTKTLLMFPASVLRILYKAKKVLEREKVFLDTYH